MQTRMVEMIFPEQANHYGTLFGGNALSLMAKAAFVAATRHVGGNVVMARSERVDFATPIRVGEILELSSRIIGTGRSSVIVEVQGHISGAARPVLSGRFVMVAVDASGRPKALADNIQAKGQDHENA